MEPDIAKLLPLARHIAGEFSNIPGLNLSEIEIHAQEALAAAARQYDPAKGNFTAYASRAIRNTLITLYRNQVRHHKHHAYVLDTPQHSSESDLVHNTPDKEQDSVGTQVGRQESLRALHRAMAQMPERYRAVLTAIGEGRSYSEIGLVMGISKQAVHKIAAAAMQSLRESLEAQGFSGLDSVGLLKSFRQE